MGRNCLLGHRKKIAKFLMRTFTCLSTFLYGQPQRSILIDQRTVLFFNLLTLEGDMEYISCGNTVQNTEA